MRKLSHLLVYAPFVALIDLALIHISFLSVLFVKGSHSGWTVPSFAAYVHILPPIFVAAVVILYIFDMYTNWLRRSGKEVAFSVVICTALICLFTMAMSLWERQFSISRGAVCTVGVILCVLLSTYRLLLRKWYLSGNGRRRVLVVAPDVESAGHLMCKIREDGPDWMCVTGCMISEELDQLEERAEHFDSVLIAPGLPEQAKLVRRCARLRKHTMVVPAVLELSLFSAHPLEVDDLLIFSIGLPHLTQGQVLMKRILDIVGAGGLLVLASPLMVIAGVAIKLMSKGPAVFKQDRLGQNGAEYTLYKLRTMVANAEKHTGPVLASDTDSRITPLGRWLRYTRIDELPQLFNVLKGDMSLVGPRPERAYFVEQFRKTVHGYDLRFGVKPGVTGLAQVAGSYSTTAERKLRFDLMYIFNYSLLIDLKILLKTVLVVLDKRQAKGVAAVAVPLRSATLVEHDE